MWSGGLARSSGSGGPTWPLWSVAALWTSLALLSPFLLIEVRTADDAQRRARAWLEDAGRLALALDPAGSSSLAPPSGEPFVSTWLRRELEQDALLLAVPLPPEDAADARRRWEQSARELLAVVSAAPPRPPSAGGRAASRVAGAAAALRTALAEVSGAVRERLSASETRAGSLWTRLFVLACAYVLGLGALGVLLFRRHAQTRALASSREALAMSQHRLQTLVQTAQDLIWAVDTAGRWTFVNESVRRIYGYAPDELLGRPFTHLLAPERVEPDRLVFREILAGKTVLQHETVHLRKDGRPVRLLLNGAAVRDRQGRVVGATGSAADVTNVVELRERVRHTDRLQALGVLAGGVAHDFNNLLTGVIGNAGFAREDRDDPERLAKDLDAIEAIAQRGRTLTRQLLAFARKQVLKREALDLVRIAREQHDFLRRLLGEEVMLRTETPPNPLWVQADRTQIEQVLMNLCVNARDALKHGRGRITVALGTTEVTAAEAARLGIAAGTWVRLDVEDDGSGMDPETQRRIFEPFFTTKEGGKGTGLGLSTAHGIVHQHGGTITVDSSPGRGTLMRVLLLPSEAPPSAAAETAYAAPGVVGAGARVLVVEDDLLVREVVQRVLTGAGFEVDAPGEPLRALEALRDGAAAPDLLVADVRMPGLSGPQLAARLRTVQPDLPVLFISGYAGRELPPRWLDQPTTAFLRKPFTPLELLAALDTLRRRTRARVALPPASAR